MAYKLNGTVIINDSAELTPSVTLASSSVNIDKMNITGGTEARGKILASDGSGAFVWADRDESIPLPTDGYLAGSGPFFGGATDQVEFFPFASPFGGGSDIGNLSQSRALMSNASGPENGYTMGGWISGPAPESDVIDKFPYASPFTTATDVGNMSEINGESSTGHQSSTDGYRVGGYVPTPAISKRIDKFPFSTPFTTATDAGDLIANEASKVGNSSSSFGYSSSSSGPLSATRVERFPFTSPFTTATDVGDLTQRHFSGSGQNSSDYGHVSGGGPVTSPTSVSVSNVVEKFPFSSPFTTATDIGDLTRAKRNSTGHNSASDGYNAGGFYDGPAPSFSLDALSEIDKFPFSTPFTTATDIGDLSSARGHGSGISG